MDKSRPPLSNVVTLGTRDLPALRSFYERLGWPIIFDSDDFVAFELTGIVLALFPLDKLAVDGHVEPERGREGIRFTIAINVDEAREVDELAQAVREAGGRITKEPVDAEFFEGRSAYFADPEDNFWEIAWATRDNPVLAAARRAARLDR